MPRASLVGVVVVAAAVAAPGFAASFFGGRPVAAATITVPAALVLVVPHRPALAVRSRRTVPPCTAVGIAITAIRATASPGATLGCGGHANSPTTCVVKAALNHCLDASLLVHHCGDTLMDTLARRLLCRQVRPKVFFAHASTGDEGAPTLSTGTRPDSNSLSRFPTPPQLCTDRQRAGLDRGVGQSIKIVTPTAIITKRPDDTDHHDLHFERNR